MLLLLTYVMHRCHLMDMTIFTQSLCHGKRWDNFLYIWSLPSFPLLSKASPAVASAQKCPPAAAPNAKNVKQMLLDWCRAKTEPYEVHMPWLSLSVNYCSIELYIALPLYASFFTTISFKLALLWDKTGSGHPELLFKLERWNSLLCFGPPILPRRVWILDPQPQQTQGQLPAGLHHCRVRSKS